MATIALFHSALGLRQGVTDAASRLLAHGHAVTTVDQYEGRTFDDYEEAAAYVESVGFPALLDRALEATADLVGPFVVMGFSNGGGVAEFVAAQRPDDVRAAVLLSGALPLDLLGLSWPGGVPVQIHYTLDDPFRSQDWLDRTVTAIRESGSDVEVFDYPGSGHLFTDASLVEEFQPEEAALLWERVDAFLAGIDAG